MKTVKLTIQKFWDDKVMFMHFGKVLVNEQIMCIPVGTLEDLPRFPRNFHTAQHEHLTSFFIFNKILLIHYTFNSMHHHAWSMLQQKRFCQPPQFGTYINLVARTGHTVRKTTKCWLRS